MNVKVDEIMSAPVIKTELYRTIAHVRTLIKRNHVGAIPIVNEHGEAMGIISASDLLEDLNEEDPAAALMSDKIYTIPQYEDVAIAARVMRNHKIHHLIVTHEKQVVGMLSSLDLLKLVEDHRFTAKNAPTESTRKGSKKK